MMPPIVIFNAVKRAENIQNIGLREGKELICKSSCYCVQFKILQRQSTSCQRYMRKSLYNPQLSLIILLPDSFVSFSLDMILKFSFLTEI